MFTIKIIPMLGLWNVGYMMWYRLSLKLGIRKLMFPKQDFKLEKLFFNPIKSKNDVKTKKTQRHFDSADRLINGQLCYYAYHWKQVGNTPSWFLNPFNNNNISFQQKHWTKLPDFSTKIGDIKNIWEASRFNWALLLAWAYATSGNSKYLSTLNKWCMDWALKNPLNIGPNWKCGQESSIRVFNLIIASLILGQDKTPSSVLTDFVNLHLKRIKTNILYAIAQDNNHGISEAAALFIGGAWLHSINLSKYPEALGLSKIGRKWLENRVENLVMGDGSFSQHSVVYHRMILDILSLAEYFRSYFYLQQFRPQFYSKVNSAINWYSTFIDPISGNAPNLGTNDGTLLFDCFSENYRDFKPSLTFSSAIFNCPIPEVMLTRHSLMDILDIHNPDPQSNCIKPQIFNEGGYCKLVGKDSLVYMRLPIYKFRPSHSDAMHIDIWKDGVNLVRDAGSYSYGLPITEQEKFSGTKGHSTIQFDNRNQMPRISRFLYGEWLNPIGLDCNLPKGVVRAEYLDYYGARHIREVSAIDKGWKIIDNISGKFNTAIQRWILAPNDWVMDGYSISSGNVSISMITENIKRFEIISSVESLYYMVQSSVPVLEVELLDNCKIETLIIFQA